MRGIPVLKIMHWKCLVPTWRKLIKINLVIFNLFYSHICFGPQVCKGISRFKICGVVTWSGSVRNIISPYTDTHTHKHTHTQTHTHTHKHTHIRTNTHTNTHTYAQTHTHTQRHTHTYKHTHTHTYTHTHTHHTFATLNIFFALMLLQV